MAATTRQQQRAAIPKFGRKSSLERLWFVILSVFVIGYAFLAGVRTLTEFDLGWLLATGRWIAQHRQIPSTDVFSYTAQGQPWIYPIGSSLIFYAAWLVGGYALITWLGAAACAATTALLLRRGSVISGLLAILAVPLIAVRTRPRADMFTVLLFATFLALLWRYHRTGRSPLWLLPVLMVAWVNLHLGFVVGLALIAGYVLTETSEMVWPGRRKPALERLRQCGPWLIAVLGATLVNPWGWEIYTALLHQERAMAAQLQWIPEWGSVPLNWTIMSTGLSLRDPGGAFFLMLLITAATVPVTVLRKQLGAAALLSGASLLAVRYIRFEALFGIVTVIVGADVLSSAPNTLQKKIRNAQFETARCGAALTVGAVSLAVVLACLRSADLVSDRSYLASTDLGVFGVGLSWWFPERGATFLERENVPAQIFNTYNEGGYFTWRLGSKYLDYVDGRAIPFGPELVEQNSRLLATSPESPEWQREAEHYNINAILVPLGRYNGLHLFPMLRQFCGSEDWPPVYLDEVSAVFVRRRPENEDLIARLRIQCATAPLPAVVPEENTTEAFNHWANAAAVLHALGRNGAAFEATSKALAIFPGSAFVHSLRGNLFVEAGSLRNAEQQYLLSASLESNGTIWSSLGAIYHRQGRLMEEIEAWEHASALLPYPAPELLALGYAELAARHPQKALQAFDRAAVGLAPQNERQESQRFFASLAHGRAMALSALAQQR
jgi:Tfp pilus assembly protein PilF